MAQVISGVVKGGLIVPAIPLQEGTVVRIEVPEPFAEIDPELQAEFAAWNEASLKALELVEWLANEGSENAEG